MRLFISMNVQWAERPIVQIVQPTEDDWPRRVSFGRGGERMAVVAGDLLSVVRGAEEAPEQAAAHAEIARRAASLANGDRRRRQALALPDAVVNQVEAAGRRARSLIRAGGGCEESRRAAAVDFVAAVTTALALDGDAEAGDLRELVARSAAAIGISRGAANIAVFRHAIASPKVSELPPPRAYDLIVTLLLEFAPAKAASLWTQPVPGRLECVASAGVGARSRRVQVAARALLDERVEAIDGTTHIRAVPIERWDRRHAALVARGRPEASGRLAAYLAEAAAALSPFFEREALFDHNAARERSLVSASERRLTRLGCDLHDGPLQELVALADDVRRARDQIASVLDAALVARVRGRFDDLEARLASLDRGLRDISHAVRPTSAVERPLEQALRAEVDAFNRSGTTQAQLMARGDLSGLTASQSIVFFRVVQEALSNARRHSEASRVRVVVRSTPRYISVSVSDDGRGFDVDAASRSGRLGLTGLIERVRLLGGDVEVESAPGRGTRLRVTLPRWSSAPDQVAPLYAVTA
jgi:signal transduction histidine kinase